MLETYSALIIFTVIEYSANNSLMLVLGIHKCRINPMNTRLNSRFFKLIYTHISALRIYTGTSLRKS